MSASNRVMIGVVDGTEMAAYVAHPRGNGPFPAILVFQEALGVNAQIRDVADRYAALGFVAVAPDLFHRFAPGFETQTFDREVIMPLIEHLTIDGMITDVAASYQWAAGQRDIRTDKIAAVGYCMGGRAAYLANSEVPLAAAISYYGGGIAPALLDRAARLNGPHLFFWGGRDPGIPPEKHRAVTDAVRDAGKQFVDAEFSDAQHGFFNVELDRGNPRAARESWALGRAFLANALEIDLGQG